MRQNCYYYIGGRLFREVPYGTTFAPLIINCEAKVETMQINLPTKFQNSARPILIALFLLVFGGLLAACGTTHAQTITITATPPPTPTVVQPTGVMGPDNFPADVNPLTGEIMDDPALLQRRPLGIKISNAPDVVRPQAGIGQADLVFEHYVEGSLTRFTAIFWTHNPPRVGSVRSARLLDLELPTMYGTLFAYSGASAGVRQKLIEAPFAPRNYEGVTVGQPLFFRDPNIASPNNLFVVPDEVWKRAEEQGVGDLTEELNGMVFLAEPPESDLPGNRLTIDYGPDDSQWAYDPETGRYLRSVDDVPHTDANTGEQISAANVVVVYAHHQLDLSIVESEFNGNVSYSTEIQIWTLGPAVLLRDGKAYRGYWTRWEEADMLTFWTDEAMTERLYFKPGNTWFQVVPLDFAELVIE